jgi:hypothetical protein
VCITSVGVISLEVRQYGPNGARILWSTIVFDVPEGFLYDVTAGLIIVTGLNMVVLI